MSPLLSGQPFPLNLGHASTAKDQGAEFIDQPILLGRVVVGLKNSRLRFSWFSRPTRTSAAIALLMLVSVVSAYRCT
jgi:hypothetical protein